MTVLQPFAYQTRPDWTHGTVSQRRDLLHALWSQAKAMSKVPSESKRSGEYARAAVLLAAQEVGPFGNTMISYLLNDPTFDRTVRLDRWQAIRLKRHVEDHVAISQVCFGSRARAEKMIEAITGADAGSPGGTVSAQGDVAAAEAVRILDSAIEYSRGRSNLQFQLSTTAWRLFALRPAPAGIPKAEWVRRWRQRFPDDVHFDRWICEAVAASPDSPAPVVTRSNLKDFRGIPRQ
jgi:hypothetical protein